MKKFLTFLVGSAAAVAVAVAPAANAAPTPPKHNHPPATTGGGNVGAYPMWSTVNCDGVEIGVYAAGGDNPTDSSKCPTPES
jgi:hypothetical protein